MKIRKNVFETNSSSSHVITISDKMELDTIIPNDRGTIILRGGEFGRVWHKHNKALAKANYCAVLANHDTDKLKMIEKVICDQTKAISVHFFINTYDWEADDYSSIDHQSCLPEEIENYNKIFESEESLRQFIFNKNSWLFMGNDNTPHPPNFYDDPKTKYAYLLTVEGTEISEKFVEYPDEQQIKDALNRIMELLIECSRSFFHWTNEGYDFCVYEIKDKNGNRFNSFRKLQDNIVVLFKREPVYGINRNFMYDKILDTKELKFEISKL